MLAVVSAQKLQTKAEDIHQRQVMFLAMVAHELRNPLNPIRMATELLQHAQANEGLLGQVQGILRRQVSHLALAIVRELVEAHGGTIVAASAGRGLGSEFVVTLPVLPGA